MASGKAELRRAELHDWAQQRMTSLVHDYMRRQGLSHRDAAFRFGFSASTFNARMNGGSNWTLTDVLFMCEYMRVEFVPSHHVTTT